MSDTSLVVCETCGVQRQVRSDLVAAWTRLHPTDCTYVAVLRQQLDEARGELENWRSGRRRKGMPVIESVPDGLHYAAELVRAQGTEGGEDHDRLLRDAGMRLKALNDAAAALLADRDRLLDVYRAAEAWREQSAGSILGTHERPLAQAVDSYRSAAPAEPAPGGGS